MTGDRGQGECEPPDGILVIDKPVGMSSAQVVARIKRLVRARKAGHAGTLDPFASGVLVCCLNQATKLARFLLSGPKRYDALLMLGVTTDTQDATGTVVARRTPEKVSAQAVRAAFEDFKGAIDQQPPVFSALKYKGKPLYQLARSGRPVQKPPRRVHVYELDIHRIEPPAVAFTVRCSAGTYIRTLCHDIGRVLGCGGHLKALRRTESSGFPLEQALTLDEAAAEAKTDRLARHVVPMAAALPWMPSWVADEETTRKIRHGRQLSAEDLGFPANLARGEERSGYFKVIDGDHRLIAVLRRREGHSRLEYCCVFPD